MCFSYFFWNSIWHFKVDLEKKKSKKKILKKTKDFKTQKHVKILDFRTDDIFGQVPNYSLISQKEIRFSSFTLIGFSFCFLPVS